MNLLLLEPNEIKSDGTVCLRDRRSRHIVRILGLGPGDTVKTGIINGSTGRGEIVSVRGSDRNPEVVLRFFTGDRLPELPPVDLVMGLVRPIMLKRILAQAASLGVGRIYLINGSRVEKSFFEASLLKEDNYRSYLLQGLEQAKDTFLPQVSIHARFRPFVEDFIPTVAQNYSGLLGAHPEGGLNIRDSIGPGFAGRILLAVGPEGGWVEFDLEKFAAQSFRPVSLGRRVLRTDTAVVALLAQLMLLREERGRDGTPVPAVGSG